MVQNECTHTSLAGFGEVRGSFSVKGEGSSGTSTGCWEGGGGGCTLTFGRAQYIGIAEAAHEGRSPERVQANCSRAEVLHGHVPHLAGRGRNVLEGKQPRPSPGSAWHPAHLKPSQVEGIGHLPVSIAAFFSEDGNSGGSTAWGKECLWARALRPHPSPRTPLPGQPPHPSPQVLGSSSLCTALLTRCVRHGSFGKGGGQVVGGPRPLPQPPLFFGHTLRLRLQPLQLETGLLPQGSEPPDGLLHSHSPVH